MQLMRACAPTNTHTQSVQGLHALTPLSLPLRPVHCHSNGSLETTGGGTQDSMSHSTGFVCVCVYIYIVHQFLFGHTRCSSHSSLLMSPFLTLLTVHNPGILFYYLDPDTLKTQNPGGGCSLTDFFFCQLKLRLKIEKPRKP